MRSHIFAALFVSAITILLAGFSAVAYADGQVDPDSAHSLSSLSGNYSLGGQSGYILADSGQGRTFETDLYAQADSSHSPRPVGGGYYGTKDWQVFAALYLWLSGLNGTTGIGNTTADVDVSFGDIWKNFDIGVQAHIELWWKKWLFFVDPTYIKLSSNSSQSRVITTLNSDTEVKLFVFEFAGGYRVAEVPLGSNIKSNAYKTWPLMNVDLYGGGRVFSIDSTIDVTLDTPLGPVGERFNTTESWFDFIVGTRLLFYLTENLLFVTRTDVGGFGLGFSSDISWNFIVNVGYELPWAGITPYVGYRVLYIDYQDGSGDDRFEYDIWQTGPQVGVGVRF